MIDANWFAIIAIIGMILSSFAVLGVRKPEEFAINLVVASFLFMPVGSGFRFPGFPMFDKDSLPYLCIFIMYWFRRGGWVSKQRPFRGPEFLLLLSLITGHMTTVTNPEPLVMAKAYPYQVTPGLSFHDTLSVFRGDLVTAGIPFLLGRVLMRSSAEGLHLLKAFGVGGLVYIFPILIELRMSPQMHMWFYGRAARPDFMQNVRDGGYRPVVFMPHGLAVALFMCMALIAATVLMKNRQKILGFKWKPFVGLLTVILVTCKSMAALLYGVVMIPVIWLTKPKRWVTIGLCFGVMFLVYPLLRAYDLVPTDRLLEMSHSLGGSDRMGSLESRFNSEKLLLERARLKMAWGWGGYGRASVVNDYGKEQAIFDGYWITLLAHRGAVWLVVSSIFLTWSLFRASRRLKRIHDEKDRMLVGGLSLMLGVAVFDLIPNGLFVTYPWFLSGALYGLVRTLEKKRPEPLPAPGTVTEPYGSPYSGDPFATENQQLKTDPLGKP
jgi:hypothetical protein